MKIKIVRSKFMDALKKVQNIVSSRGTLQIIQNVLMQTEEDKLVLTTTDLDMSIRTAVSCEVDRPGETTLPVKLLVNTVTKAPDGVIEMEVNPDDNATLVAGSAIFRISGMGVADFPNLPESGETFEYVLPQLTLREMLRKTAYAASQDDTRKTLRGVLSAFKDGKLTMVATDGRRLALVEHEIDIPESAEQEVILPSKVVGELQRSLETDGDVRITIENKQISFNLGDTQVYSKVLDDVYPNYRQVIPGECQEKVAIDRQQLLSALDRVSVMSMDESNSTKLTFSENQLIVSSEAHDRGQARDIVPIRYEGPFTEIVFNPNYVMDPLKAIDEDEVTIEFNNGSTPSMIKCSIPFLYVMMPLRIN